MAPGRAARRDGLGRGLGQHLIFPVPDPSEAGRNQPETFALAGVGAVRSGHHLERSFVTSTPPNRHIAVNGEGYAASARARFAGHGAFGEPRPGVPHPLLSPISPRALQVWRYAVPQSWGINPPTQRRPRWTR
jgi:hypothetical protein